MIVPQLRGDFCKNVEYSYNGMPRCGVTGNRGRRSRADSLRLIRSARIIRSSPVTRRPGYDAAMF